MITFIPTGSQMDRIVRCPASAALPQVRDAYASDARDRGTAMHTFLERAAQVGRESALAEVDEQWRPFCAQIDLAAFADRLSLTFELAVAYDWVADKARILQPLEHRAYEVDVSREIPLTIDVAGVGDRVVYAGDFKSGYGWLPAPSESMQLGLGALALARLHRARAAHVEYLRIRDDGSAHRFAAQIDVFGLDQIAARVAATMQHVAALRASIHDGDQLPDVQEGPHCTYCPARNTCPAKVQLVRSVLAGDGAKLSLREPITAENVGRVYQLVKKAKEGIRIAEKALHAYERDGEPSTPERLSPSAIPIGPDPDGSMRYFGRFERAGNEQLDGKVVYEVLAERFGPDAAAKACAMEASKDAIRDVVRTYKAEGETIKEVEEALLAAIRAKGGAKRPPTDKAAEFVIGPEGTVKKAPRKKAS